jgi:hypothetical protein
VAIALALEPGDRYQTAREMGRALSDGAYGIAVQERHSPARSAPATQATKLLTSDRALADTVGRRAGGAEVADAGAVTPRTPRRGPPRVSAPVVADAGAGVARARRGGRRRGRGLLLGLLGLLVLAGAIVAVALATAPAPTRVTLRHVVYSDVQRASSALRELVEKNTK